jgi:molybdopterin synthase sulfur carrier subunit
MAKVHLPQNLVVLFPGAPRQVEVAGTTVLEVMDGLNQRFPGMKSRLVDAGPVLREHILVFVDKEQAGLQSPVRPDSEVRIIPSITGG